MKGGTHKVGEVQGEHENRLKGAVGVEEAGVLTVLTKGGG